MSFATADLCDEYGDSVRVLPPLFRHYGQRKAFSGTACTLRVFEDNTLVRGTLETPGENRVLVVDGGGSTRCALMGDNLAQLLIDNGWAGAIINGCIRDSAEINAMDVGVRALASHPRKSRKLGHGESEVAVVIEGGHIKPGDMIHVDEDGIIVGSGTG